MQVRTKCGKSFWDLSDICWEKLKFGCPFYHEDDWWVKWEGREWLCKRKEDSLNEIIGYQIAQAFGLPVQPWAAFLQINRPGYDGHPFLTGVLVERWPDAQHYKVKDLAISVGLFALYQPFPAKAIFHRFFAYFLFAKRTYFKSAVFHTWTPLPKVIHLVTIFPNQRSRSFRMW